MSDPTEPTGEQCSANAPVTIGDRSGFACWYPQMGGYVAKAVIFPDDGCFDALVWHDGDFPFSGGDLDPAAQSPRELHHCDPDQFVAFGEMVTRLLATLRLTDCCDAAITPRSPATPDWYSCASCGQPVTASGGLDGECGVCRLESPLREMKRGPRGTRGSYRCADPEACLRRCSQEPGP